MISKQQTLEDVIAARKLIEKPEAWTQGVYAKDKQGNIVTSDDPIACSFCSEGALYRATGFVPGAHTRASLARAGAAISEVNRGITMGIITFNDLSEHHEVIAQFDKTIARLSAA